MNRQREIVNIIKAISGQANVLTIPRLYVTLTKSHRAALLLSQCVYWSDRTKDPDGWFYKTAKDWQEELGMPKGAVETALKTIGKYVETKVARVGPTPKSHYKVKYDLLVSDISDLLDSGKSDLPESRKSDLPENGQSTIAEITTETTLERVEFSELFPERNHPQFEKGPHTPEEARARIAKALQSGGENGAAAWVPEPVRGLALAFTAATGITAGKEERGAWIKQLTTLAGAGITPEAVGRAVEKMNRDGLTIARPASVLSVARSMLAHHEEAFIPTKEYY